MSNVIPFPKPPKKRRRLLMIMIEVDLGNVTPKEAKAAQRRYEALIDESMGIEPEPVMYSSQLADVVDVH